MEKDLLGLEPGQSPDLTAASQNSDGTLEQAVVLYQSGDPQAALPIFQSYAEQDELAAMLAAKILKESGDEVGYRRYLFLAADKLNSGSAALMLANDYFQADNHGAALIWAEKAHRAKTKGAGQLLLRLSEKTGQWEKCLALALEELAWMTGYERFSLCEEIRALLDGNHYSDDAVLQLVEPALHHLDDDPVAKELLEKDCKKAQKGKDKAEEQKRLAEEKAQLAQAAEQARQEAKKDAEKRAKQAKKAAARAQKSTKAKAAAVHTGKKALPILLTIALPLLLNLAAHWVVMSFFPAGFKFFVASAVLGLFISSVGGDIICLVNPEIHIWGFGSLMEYDKDFLISTIKFSPLCFALCGIYALGVPGIELVDVFPYMGIISVFIQCVRGVRNSMYRV